VQLSKNLLVKSSDSGIFLNLDSDHKLEFRRCLLLTNSLPILEIRIEGIQVRVGYEQNLDERF